MSKRRIPDVRSRLGDEVVHPGRVIFEIWMHPFDISQNELARMMGVSARRVNEIVHGRRAITANSAIRLTQAFGISPHYWLALQADYDIERAFMAVHDALPAGRRVAPLTDEERDAKRFQAMNAATANPKLRPFIEWDPPAKNYDEA